MSAMQAGPAANNAAPVAKPVRVGMFDSRAVALAYYRKFYQSPEFTARLNKLKQEHAQAKAAGDEEKAKKLEAEGRGEQRTATARSSDPRRSTPSWRRSRSNSPPSPNRRGSM